MASKSGTVAAYVNCMTNVFKDRTHKMQKREFFTWHDKWKAERQCWPQVRPPNKWFGFTSKSIHAAECALWSHSCGQSWIFITLTLEINCTQIHYSGRLGFFEWQGQINEYINKKGTGVVRWGICMQKVVINLRWKSYKTLIKILIVLFDSDGLTTTPLHFLHWKGTP